MPEFVAADGTVVAYDAYGKSKNPALVLLHGAGQDRSTWKGVAEALADDHRVYCLDLRDHGEAGQADVLAFAVTQGLRDAAVIGHSPVAWRVARAAPDVVGRLVVEDSAPHDPSMAPAITAPTLVLSGTAEMAPEMREAAVRLPASELVTIPVGHHIHRDAESTFVKVVTAFLAATRDRPATADAAGRESS